MSAEWGFDGAHKRDIVFILGMVQMESLAPERIDDPEWVAFVERRVAAMLGVR